MLDDLERLARKMYENCTPYGKPTWEQLGTVTRGVWLERATLAQQAPPKKKGKTTTYCPNCGGEGFGRAFDGDCPACNGTGRVSNIKPTRSTS